MTNQDIFMTAYRQSAIDLSCDADDFLQEKSKVVLSQKNDLARRYLSLPFFCNLVTYGTNIIASVDARMVPFVENYIQKYTVTQCFETPNLLLLNDECEKFGYSLCYMAEYFLPDLSVLKEKECRYEIRFLDPPNFAELYLPCWSNALCAQRRHLDVLAVGAYDKEKLIGLASCSADAEAMWQIGIDVLPSYRRQGVAAALTSRLALAALEREKVPFYCTAWSNIPSIRNAVGCGFRPAWTEMTAMPFEKIKEIL